MHADSQLVPNRRSRRDESISPEGRSPTSSRKAGHRVARWEAALQLIRN